MLISELSMAEEAQYEKMVVTAKLDPELKKRAEAIKENYVRDESLRLVQTLNVTYEEADKIVRSRACGILLQDDTIHFHDGTVARVSEIAENIAKYDGKPCADPVEVNEGYGRAKLFANMKDFNPLIHSKLHGGINYFLKIKHILVIEQLRKKGEALPIDVWGELVLAAKLTPDENAEVFEYLRKGGAEHSTRVVSDYKRYAKRGKLEGLAKERWGEIEKVAGARHIVEYIPQNMNEVVQFTERALIEVTGAWAYFNFGGMLCLVVYDAPASGARFLNHEKAPLRPHIKQYNRSSLMLRVEQSVLFYVSKEQGDGVIVSEHIKVPSVVVSHLLNHPTPLAPHVSGLVSHPIIARCGRVVSEEGVDKETGLLLDYGGTEFRYCGPETKVPKDNADYVIRTLFSEFCFYQNRDDDRLNEHLALVMLLTALQRKCLDKAPGFLITANVQGSGKTTLAQIIHVVLTGHDLTVSTLSDNQAEAEKGMLSTLMQSPEMVCFDNIKDATEVDDPTLAKTLTSSRYSGRLLGGNQEISVPTNTMFVLTGNNLSLSNDLIRRFLSIKLSVDRERPEERIFKHKDVLQYCLKSRVSVINACLEIVHGYFEAGCPLNDERYKGSGFQQWDEMVRFPVLWATGIDVLDSMTRNREESIEFRSMVEAVSCLRETFGSKTFTAANVLSLLSDEVLDEVGEHLKECLEALSMTALKSSQGLSGVLKRLDGRHLGGLMLRYQPGRNKKGGRYAVVEVDA